MSKLEKFKNKRTLYLRNIAHWKKVIRYGGESFLHRRGLRQAELELESLYHSKVSECEQ